MSTPPSRDDLLISSAIDVADADDKDDATSGSGRTSPSVGGSSSLGGSHLTLVTGSMSNLFQRCIALDLPSQDGQPGAALPVFLADGALAQLRVDGATTAGKRAQRRV